MRLKNDLEEEEKLKNTDPRRRLELGNAVPEVPKTASRSPRRSTRSHQQNQGSPERKAQGGEPPDRGGVSAQTYVSDFFYWPVW